MKSIEELTNGYYNLAKKIYEFLVSKNLCHYGFSVTVETFYDGKFIRINLEVHSKIYRIDTTLLNFVLDFCNSNKLAVSVNTEKSMIINFFRI